MNDDVKFIRAKKIMSLVDDLRALKNEAYSTALEGNLPTVLWSLAVDITTIHSVRWVRGVIGESMIFKHYLYLAPTSEEFLTKSRTLHDTMNTLFPNTPERYTARFIVMKYIINMMESPNAMFEDLMKLKYEVD
jgi:hypothetical protein